jgi:NADP-dependent 3-hydroxy acid dehydrogenase YdfG
MGKLDGKIALIIDGSEGIGFATAQIFITEGVEHVFITGRRQEKLDEAVKKIGSSKMEVDEFKRATDSSEHHKSRSH